MFKGNDTFEITLPDDLASPFGTKHSISHGCRDFNLCTYMTTMMLCLHHQAVLDLVIHWHSSNMMRFHPMAGCWNENTVGQDILTCLPALTTCNCMDMTQMIYKIINQFHLICKVSKSYIYLN